MNFQDILPFGLSIETAIILMAACSALMTVAAVWFGLADHTDPGRRRVKEIAERREALKAGVITPRRRKDNLRSISMQRQILGKLNLLKTEQTEKITMRLVRAGWRSRDAVVRFMFAKIALPIVFGFCAIILLYGFDAYHLSTLPKLLATIFAFAAGAYAPDVFVKNVASKRRDKLRKSLPDGLDLMVICAEAGLSLDATLKRVSEEMSHAALELADELSLTSLELGFLPDRRRALDNLSSRTDLPSIRALVTTLQQAERYGTPLAQSLRVLSAEFREERMLRAEEKAARLPALLTVPMIVFILPPLFVVLIGPAILDVMDALGSL